MEADHVLNMLCTERPQWRKIRRHEFTVTHRSGRDYILFKGVEIGRVRVDGKFIYEEFLGNSNSPDDYR